MVLSHTDPVHWDIYNRLKRVMRRLAAWRPGSATPLGSQPSDWLTPRVSLPGVVLIHAFTLLASLLVMAAVYYTDIKSELHSQANSRVASLDLLLGSALGEMRALSVFDAAGCDGPVIEGLVKASMDSSIARRFYAIASDRRTVCSPLPGIGDAAARLLAQYQGSSRTPVTLLVVPDASNDILLVSEMGPREQVAAQIPGNLVRDLLGLRGKTGIATIRIRSWDGSSLIDAGWDEPYGGHQLDDILSVQKDSNTMPVTVLASARTAEVIDGAWRYALAGLLLSALIATLVVSRINIELERRSSALSRIKKALSKRQFEPVVQPIVQCETGRCIGGEILMRWQHPVRGLLAPSEFIDIAERNGLIDSMTELIMTKARDRLAALVQRNPDLYFSFNVTVSQLRRPGFADELDVLFDEQSLPGRNVVLELVERDVVDTSSRETLSELRRRGYRIAIDDFGTGQSSLALLTSMPFDLLKIDREFVRAIDSESVQRSVLSAIVDLSARLGVRSIAEGVETANQHQFLIQQGVDAIQGYLMAKPMPIEDFYHWFAGNRQQARYRQNAEQHAPETAPKPVPEPAVQPVAESVLV